jgi:hypothetical protein
MSSTLARVRPGGEDHRHAQLLDVRHRRPGPRGDAVVPAGDGAVDVEDDGGRQ